MFVLEPAQWAELISTSSDLTLFLGEDDVAWAVDGLDSWLDMELR